VAGDTGDRGPATSATLNHPRGVAVDASENFYISDSGNQKIKTINSGDN
jgi:NHL repeat